MGKIKEGFEKVNQKIDNSRQAVLSLETKTASVEGIYMTNQMVRKKALSYIWAKYNMLPDNLTQSLGRLYNAVEDIYLPNKNDKSLFNYTHDKTSLYSHSIAEKNLTVGRNNIQCSITEPKREEYKAWYNTAYQGKNYYNTLSGYSESFGENTDMTYDDNGLISIFSPESVIDYEKEINLEYAPLTTATQYYKTEWDKVNISKPKWKNFKDLDKGREKYEEKLKEWEGKKGKEFRREKKKTREEYNKSVETQNSFVKEPKTLLTKTAKLIKDNENFKSLINRPGDLKTKPTFTDTSVNEKWGRSRGRNLDKKFPSYSNPFCRVWTPHNEYGAYKEGLIRPFYNISGKTVNIEDSELIEAFRANGDGNYLKDNTVLKDGFIRITPERENNSVFNTKKCMFSIENLAWKDVRVDEELSIDQIGPNKGRIMWFPPYDLQFQESSQVSWNETNFIGRGEPIYTYTNTRRTGTLSFTLLIDHPSIMNNFDKRANKDTSENGDDNDILRFFAGCDIPMKIENKTPEPNKADASEPGGESVTTSSDGPKIKFSVYFPNNYSGHYNNTKDIDPDWAEYLFWGEGVNSIAKYYKLGYEMNATSGISNTTSYKECSTNSNNIKYYYRYDNDLCQNIREGNLTDSISYKLNIDKGGNDISFGELYTKLSIDKNEVFQYALSKKVINANRVFKNSNVEKLNNLGMCKIHLTGVGTSQDPANTEKLAKRRLETVKKFLDSHRRELGIKDVKFEESTKTENVNDNNVNSLESKKGRRVEVEIIYNLPETEGVGNVKSKTNEKQETPKPETQKTVDIKYTEADYFKNIYNAKGFTYQKIVEKIKYFDPAYHSISPEGFNARLTFLHQCTRQGHTLERKANQKENVYNTAGNMAFGRPPFCVLRIGDFINTKILVRSVNIVYQNGNGMQWDMNPEGIGVQPIFAKVTMQIEIIGGQSLDAPVSRLNNAVSFNYYANTGVYDSRADRAKYNNDKIEHGNLYEPKRKK